LIGFAFGFKVLTHETFEVLTGFFVFCSTIKVKLLCYCLLCFDAIVMLHAMDEKNVQRLSHWIVKVDFICNRTCSIYELYFVYIRAACITLIKKD
jgi:hypothetical protein